MRITLFSVLTILFVTLVCLPVGFAQNIEPQNMIRLIYFLPNDRAPQPDIDTKLDKQIKDVQLLFADLLEEHGFERKTFRFETDEDGHAVVHHVNGKFDTAHYYDLGGPFQAELIEQLGQFDFSKDIYIVSLDIGGHSFRGDISGFASGRLAVLPANQHAPIAHELGHTFGLHHDYRDNFGSFNEDPMLTSFCSAEWLDVHPYFNSNLASLDMPATIQMLPSQAASPSAIRLRFEINDPDGSHQAQLITLAGHQYDAPGNPMVVDCKPLNDESNIVVEFVTSELTNGSASVATDVGLYITDVRGNFTSQWFSIDVAALLSAEVVTIPDAKLAAAVRNKLGLGPGTDITQLDMLNLKTSFWASWSQIEDVSGLEHAINLKALGLNGNQISDITPLTKLTKLKVLELAYNQISDITPLTKLTKLGELNLAYNQISDITPLVGLQHLEELEIRGNPLAIIPNRGTFTYGLSSGEAVIIESRKFAVYSAAPQRLNWNPTESVIVKSLSFHELLHNDDLVGFFEHGGTLELLALLSTGANFGDVVISEIMWGVNGKSTADQWIEFYNTTPNAITLDNGRGGYRWAIQFNYDNSGEQKDTRGLWGDWKVIDRVSSVNWKMPGQSGNTSQNQPLISMYRTINYETGDVPDGTLASSWQASTGRVNLLPPRYGTPGAEHGIDDREKITISEIMIASNKGSMPQWIELHNRSNTHAVNLKGWTLEIQNRRTKDFNLNVELTLGRGSIGPQETLLIVSKEGRPSNTFSKGQIYNLSTLHPNLQDIVLSEEGFYIKLSNATGKLIDEVGNLDGKRNTNDRPAWSLPMRLTDDGARTSMVRRYVNEVPRLGTEKTGWISAANTKLLTRTTTYYGSPNDIGAPGIESGGALPVNLSHFRAEHTNAGVILKWTTESEVDNAGFYIYRSKTRDGEFKIVNPTIISGAGTTGERNEYTWTDTTAKPNTVYYYRIEDVSHAGVREQLATVRLRGLVSARGKLTTIWADLKTQE